MRIAAPQNKRRCAFVRERLVDIEFGRKPDLDKYLDGYGKERAVTDDLAAPPPKAAEMQTSVYAALGGGMGYGYVPPIRSPV